MWRHRGPCPPHIPRDRNVAREKIIAGEAFLGKPGAVAQTLGHWAWNPKCLWWPVGEFMLALSQGGPGVPNMLRVIRLREIGIKRAPG